MPSRSSTSGPSEEQHEGFSRSVVAQTLAGIGTAIVLGAASFLWKEVSGQSLHDVLLVTSAVGLALALVAQLALNLVIWRKVAKPPWYSIALAVTLSTFIVSLATGATAVAVLDREHETLTTTTTSLPTTSSSTSPTTTRSAESGSRCTDPPIALEVQESDEQDFRDVRITVSCPVAEGQTYFLISQVDDVGQPPHTEYYVNENFGLDDAESFTYRWRFQVDAPGTHRELYVVSVTAEQEAVLKDYYDPARHLVLQLPVGLAPSSNTVEHTKS